MQSVKYAIHKNFCKFAKILNVGPTLYKNNFEKLNSSEII